MLTVSPEKQIFFCNVNALHRKCYCAYFIAFFFSCSAVVCGISQYDVYLSSGLQAVLSFLKWGEE